MMLIASSMKDEFCEFAKLVFGVTVNVHPEKSGGEYARFVLKERLVVVKDIEEPQKDSQEDCSIVEVACSSPDILEFINTSFDSYLAATYGKEEEDGIQTKAADTRGDTG